MNQSGNPTSSAAQRTPRPHRRPASIAELAARAQNGLYDERRDLKQHLRAAEKNRRTAKELHKAGDLEAAFVEYAKAATLVLEKVPTHRDYHTLTGDQQRNLALNGQDILDSLSSLKPTLVERFERWHAAHPEATDPLPAPPPPADPAPRRPERKGSDTSQRQDGHGSRSSIDGPRRVQAQSEARQRVMEEIQQRNDQERRLNEELALMKQQRQQSSVRYIDDTARTPGGVPNISNDERRRREEPIRHRDLELTFSKRPDQGSASSAAAYASKQDDGGSTGPSFPVPSRRPDDVRSLQQQRQQQQFLQPLNPEDVRRLEEETARRRVEEKRRLEQEGITRRMQEADAAAHALRQSSGGSSTGHSQYPSQMTSASAALRAPKAVSSRPAAFLDTFPEAMQMPLESPTRYEGDSTDSEALGDGLNSYMRHARAIKHNGPPKAPARSPIYPPPITTTSPPPSDLAIRYPEIMSQHQRLQGYVPSLHSMFNPMMRPPAVPSSLLFEPDPQSASSRPPQPYSSSQNQAMLYPADMLPRPSQPVVSTHPFADPQPQPRQQRQQQIYSHEAEPKVSKEQAPAPRSSASSQARDADPPPSSAPRITRSSSNPTDPVTRELKSVNLPRECLPRFLSIAAVNTGRNRETCGLLLGKDKERKFVVTTLLIPKQHSTSDTCTMDEEELVLKFTEERSLITLGWIHTHPSQSCFMSSVDLHTHSGFQRMLPESFAVVCAPKSNPNFGIFRLTDPPGLEAILTCNAKDAFHPHPDMPIYTDADKGHVQMKDIPLEIVDLR